MSCPAFAAPPRAESSPPQLARRNDPCPCGSGKKHKRCCAAAPAVAGAATSPPPSRADQLRAIAPRLEPAHIACLSLCDLEALDLKRLRYPALVFAVDHLAALQDWQRAHSAVQEAGRRRGARVADELLQRVVHQATRARDYDVAARLFGQLERPERAPDLELEIALATPGPGVLRLESVAAAALRDDEGISAIDLAYAALRTSPALGILLARGALPEGTRCDGEALLQVIDEARVTLGLSPVDPARALFAALDGAPRAAAGTDDLERSRLTRVAAELRIDLERATSRRTVVDREMAELQRELHRARNGGVEASAQVSDRPDEAARTDALRQQVEALQALLRDSNAERAELRRQLRSNERPGAGPPATRPAPRDRDRDEPDEEIAEAPTAHEAGRVRLPRFSAHGVASFEEAQRHIAANAMRMVGLLAAGDAGAWRRTKQARDMPRPVGMMRVGIYHRLLFRAEDGALEVLDLVARKDLAIALKRLRGG